MTLLVLGAWMAFLVAIAFWGDARSGQLDRAPQRRAWLYVLGLGVYCTSWTFYGAVGDASRNGWDYLPIYLGPALVFLIGFSIIRRLVRLGREHNTGSIADFLSARYGKSAAVGALAAGGLLLAVIPYIALQLKSAASTLSLMVGGNTGGIGWSLAAAVAFAAFAILFGQRHVDAAAGNRGLVLAVAAESLIKLVAMAAVGIFAFAVWNQIPMDVRTDVLSASPLFGGGIDFRFVVLTVLAGFAALTLPRQFHMMVVETRKPEDANLSRFGFPLYLAVVAFVAPPVALTGTAVLDGADPDAFVLALPIAMGAEGLALLAFIGGFSAAAGMVTVAALAMSTMIVNDLAAPLLLKTRLSTARGFAASLLMWRRVAVVGLVAAALMFQLGMDRSVGLAGIGLVSFAGAAQLAPALLFGLYWRRANRAGALSGIGTGLVLWFGLILVPTYTGAAPPAPVGVDPFAFASAICLIANVVVFIVAVAFSSTGLVDQMQADAFTGRASSHGHSANGARLSDLESVLTRVLGKSEAAHTLSEITRSVGRELKSGDTPTPAVISLAEARLARALGAASARILMTRVLTGARVSPGDVVTLIDETAEKLRSSHDRLEESERSIRFYTDHLPALLSYADRDYRLRFANQGYLDFFEIDANVIGAPLASFMSKEDYDLRRPHMDAALHGDRQVFDISRKMGGRRRSWQVVYQPRYENEEVVGFFCIYQDNTARREAELGLKRAYETLEVRVEERTAALKAESEARLDLAKDLEQARRAAEAATQSKTRFLAAASHDLLQPLSAARLFAGALEEDLKGASEGQAKLAQRIERSIDHADRLLRALLDISRLDADGVTPRQSVFSLGELMQETAAQSTPKAEAKGLRLRVVPCRLAAFSDRGLMTSVLQNLISNAVRYTQTGSVLVGARRHGDTVRLQVIDTGPGVPVERQRAIFKEFERGSNTDQADRGLGLGLAVVDRICTTLGHKLRLQSEVGKGSTFEVTLPRAASKPARQRRPRRRAEALDGLKVLCLEDEAPVLEATVALLRRWGCDARGACDETTAHDAFKDGSVPDVVVLDYQLEDGETGPAVYSRLCKDWGTEPPGVLITAERGQDAESAARAAGLELIQKPAPPAVLRATLANLKRRAG